MCYTTGGLDASQPISTSEPVGPTIRDPSLLASDPVTRGLLADRGFLLTPGSRSGFSATSGSGVPFVSRGLISAMGNGTARLSPIDRISPIAQAISQPFQQADQSARSVR